MVAKATWRRIARVLGARINVMSYLPKWLILASVIGIIAGLGAMVFYEALSRREGPTAQISAGFGSLLARTLDLSPEVGGAVGAFLRGLSVPCGRLGPRV